MRTSYKFFAGVAAAGLVIAGGSAYTAANTVPATAGAGYGSSTATGVTVATMAVNPAANPVNLANVTYTVATDVSNAEGWLFELSTDAGATVIDSDCTATYTTETTIVCTPAGTTTLASLTNLGLTATQTQ